MLTRAVTVLPEPSACEGGCAYEPKWDGWRVLLFRDEDGGVTLQSRQGRDLTRYFPEVVRLARGSLPPSTVVDGELIVWAPDRRRMSFALLQRRLNAGARRVLNLAVQHPAHLAAFDLLHSPTLGDIRARPLRERREHLARLLTDAPPQLTLSQQTTDPAQARAWMIAWAPLGIEGIVIKALGDPYRPGQRGWLKLRSRNSTEAIIAGVTGTLSRPESLLLGRFDADDVLRYVGRTKPLTPRQRVELAGVLRPPRAGRRRPTTHPWPRPLPGAWLGQLGNRADLDYSPTEPDTVAEVEVDSAYEHHRWRHQPTFLRLRPELSPYDVPITEEPP